MLILEYSVHDPGLSLAGMLGSLSHLRTLRFRDLEVTQELVGQVAQLSNLQTLVLEEASWNLGHKDVSRPSSSCMKWPSFRFLQLRDI